MIEQNQNSWRQLSIIYARDQYGKVKIALFALTSRMKVECRRGRFGAAHLPNTDGGGR
jgi:hypothetical protein